VSSPASARRPTDVDLSVRIGTLLLSNPVIAASGIFGYGIEFAHLVDLNCLGGIVVKGLSAKPMEGAPSPRLCETSAGMLNAVGLQNVGVRAFVEDKLPQLQKYRTAIVANVFGHTVTEYYLEGGKYLSGYEPGHPDRLIPSRKGLSGPAIKPMTLRVVYEFSRTVQLPIIDLGGIQTGEDAAEYIRAGATAIQV
jgi:dihydroorotate dehydrogenase